LGAGLENTGALLRTKARRQKLTAQRVPGTTKNETTD